MSCPKLENKHRAHCDAALVKLNSVTQRHYDSKMIKEARWEFYVVLEAKAARWIVRKFL